LNLGAAEGRSPLRIFIVALATVLYWPNVGLAQFGAQPPCGITPQPAFAPPDSAPALLIWSAEAKWVPPACTGWRREGSEVGAALAGSFRFGGSTADLIARFGAVSTLRGIRYWSVSDRSWKTLIESAAAVEDPDRLTQRRDFSVAEMTSGNVLYFVQRDNRSSADVLYAMRMREAGPDHLRIDIENASTVKLYMFSLYKPGELQSSFFIDRLAPDIWGFYSLSRSLNTPSLMPGDPGRSSANRAIAFYRHFIGEQTDHDPPVAP
jgi:hypothetical protein